jgi:hypothetical protein
MKKYAAVLLGTVVGVVTLGAETSHAQYSNPYSSPYNYSNVSPYLPLLSRRAGGGGLTGNYYGLVVPQEQLRANVDAVNRQSQANRLAIAQVEESGELTTGKAAGFMNYGRYFGGSSGQRQTYSTVPLNSAYSTGTPNFASPRTRFTR